MASLAPVAVPSRQLPPSPLTCVHKLPGSSPAPVPALTAGGRSQPRHPEPQLSHVCTPYQPTGAEFPRMWTPAGSLHSTLCIPLTCCDKRVPMAGAGCPSPHPRPLPGGTCCLLTWKMSAGGRSGVATAGNGPSTGTDPPASSPGQLSAPLCPTPQVQCCPAPVPMASITVLLPVPSTGRAPWFSTGVQKCLPGKAKQENVSM